MKFSNRAFLALAFASFSFDAATQAFSPFALTPKAKSFSMKGQQPQTSYHTTTKLFSQLQEEEKVAETETDTSSIPSPDAEGLPWWWDAVWKLDVMQTGEPGTVITFGDSANVLRTNIEQIYGGYPSKDGCPLAEGELDDIGDGTMFIGLERYYNNYGSPYKLCFGPK